MPDARFGVGNIPGGRYAPAAWTDKSGHCWMFGGYGYDSKGKFADFNDLWKYDLGSPGPTTITPHSDGDTGFINHHPHAVESQNIPTTHTPRSNSSDECEVEFSHVLANA